MKRIQINGKWWCETNVVKLLTKCTQFNVVIVSEVFGNQCY